jgi:hypothetical protein
MKRAPDTVMEDGNQAYLKRQKIKHVVSSAEDIQSSGQLKDLLAFDQDAGRAKHGTVPQKISLSITEPISRNPIFQDLSRNLCGRSITTPPEYTPGVPPCANAQGRRRQNARVS